MSGKAVARLHAKGKWGCSSVPEVALSITEALGSIRAPPKKIICKGIEK